MTIFYMWTSLETRIYLSKIKNLLYVYVYSEYMHISVHGATLHLKKTFESQELKVQMAVSHYLGAGAASFLKCWPILHLQSNSVSYFNWRYYLLIISDA